MLGFLISLPCWGSALLAPFQEPENPDLGALQAKLAEPALGDRDWRVSVWEHLTRLEHVGDPAVLQGWEALAASGADPDLANLFLFQRRQGLPRLPLQEGEGPELTLERCLAAWGDGDLAETARRLRAALERFPEDRRLQENLLWLEMRRPAVIELDGSGRHLALAVLAARDARG
ncbi:MAG: hypothetical protein CMJ94_15065 [Planctomycetes bacterium]|nr:hypothetical protein [Planctomycetota bacterium]